MRAAWYGPTVALVKAEYVASTWPVPPSASATENNRSYPEGSYLSLLLNVAYRFRRRNRERHPREVACGSIIGSAYSRSRRPVASQGWQIEFSFAKLCVEAFPRVPTGIVSGDLVPGLIEA